MSDKKPNLHGIPWRSSGYNSALSLPRARVQSRVVELTSLKLHTSWPIKAINFHIQKASYVWIIDCGKGVRGWGQEWKQGD